MLAAATHAAPVEVTCATPGMLISRIEHNGVRPLNCVELHTGPYVSHVLHETRNMVRAVILLPPLLPFANNPNNTNSGNVQDRIDYERLR